MLHLDLKDTNKQIMQGTNKQNLLYDYVLLTTTENQGKNAIQFLSAKC